jgi:hypothetical protein
MSPTELTRVSPAPLSAAVKSFTNRVLLGPRKGLKKRLLHRCNGLAECCARDTLLGPPEHDNRPTLLAPRLPLRIVARPEPRPSVCGPAQCLVPAVETDDS